MIRCIRADEVKPGMRIHNSHASRPEFAWVRVTDVRRSGAHVIIKTNVYETWKDAREAVSVQVST